MKLYLSILFIQSAAAFAPAATTKAFVSQTALAMSRPDASQAIKEAMAASKKYGATSKEAMIAWDIVEEMDSSDMSAAYTGGVSDEECLTDNSKACMEYDDKVKALSGLLSEQKANIEAVKNLAKEIQAIKIPDPSSTVSPDSAMMKKVLADAKAAVAEHGIDSTQAKIAWETVEEVASSDNSHAYQASLDEECLVEAIEACEAIEEITRVLSLGKTNSRYQG